MLIGGRVAGTRQTVRVRRRRVALHAEPAVHGPAEAALIDRQCCAEFVGASARIYRVNYRAAGQQRVRLR